MSVKNVIKFIKEKEAEFVDLRFTDPKGKASTPNYGCNYC